MLHKINTILKICIIISLLILAILSISYKFGDCDKCSFKINNKSYNSKEFMSIYQEKCLKDNETNLMP